MARDPDALKLVIKWAGTGQRSDPEDQSLSRTTGWPASYSPPGDDFPEREVFNQLLSEISALAKEVNERGGILEYSAELAYVVYARVMGSDGLIYKSKVAVTALNTVDPVTDTSENVWELDSPDIPAASTSVAGTVRAATSTEVGAGVADDGDVAFVTPQGFRSAGDGRYALRGDVPDAPGSASTTVIGTVRFATNGEIDSGASGVVIDPAGVRRLGDNRYVRTGADGQATESKRGTAEFANSSESLAGTSGTRMLSALRAKGVYAPINSPTFTGTPDAPHPSTTDDSTRIATTGWSWDRFARTSHSHNYASSSHSHSGFASSSHSHSGFASSVHSHNYASPSHSHGSGDLPSSAHSHPVYSPIASPTFTGTPDAPNPSSTDDSTRIATTSWSLDRFARSSHSHSYASTSHTHSYASPSHTHSVYARIASPTFTGTPDAPNPSTNDDSTRIATTAWSRDLFARTSHFHSVYAPIASPTFTGTPEAPNPDSGEDSTRIATTAWSWDRFARRSHSHSYASSGHTHSGFASSSHTHSYAATGHGHTASSVGASATGHSHSGHVTGVTLSTSSTAVQPFGGGSVNALTSASITITRS